LKRLFLGIAALLITTLAAQAQTCPTSCPTREDVVLQKLLDAAAAAGGGTVHLKAGVYYTCKPLILGSNVHLRGAGRGATIIRGSQVIQGMTVGNAYVGASIAAVATNNTSVTDLTIDHVTCGRNANGIAFMPSGQSSSNTELYDGTVPTNGLVERVQVLGAPGHHNYMIWNLKGQHMKIADNWVDGGSVDGGAQQEGIESFGGHDVVIANNSVKNIGIACINLGSAGIVDSETVGLFVADNYLTNCNKGIHLGTSNGNGAQSNSHTHIRGNVITNVRETGIDIAVVSDTIERDLQVVGNTIRNISGNQVTGIKLRANGAAIIQPTAIVATTIDSNHIDNITGQNAFGISVIGYPNARVLNNTIVDTSSESIYAYDAADIEIVANRIERSGTMAIGLYKGPSNGALRFSIERNKISNWGTGFNGVLVLGARYGVIRDNVFSRTDSVLASPISADSATCSVTVSGNIVWYNPSWPGKTTTTCQ
jgi:hypothetical protein